MGSPQWYFILCVIFEVRSCIISRLNITVKNTSLAVGFATCVLYTGVGYCGGHFGHIASKKVSVVSLVVNIRLPTASTMKDLIKAVQYSVQ